MNESYEAPAITVVGSVEALTAANTTRVYLDAHFMAGERKDHGIRPPVTS
ncbi:lasso RiPP family leader peptide-containing protein [uncultured Jatrophihabitans sp.]